MVASHSTEIGFFINLGFVLSFHHHIRPHGVNLCDHYKSGEKRNFCNFSHFIVFLFPSGEKKLVKIATPDPWKVGSRAAGMKAKKRLNENKLLTGGKGRYHPQSGVFKKCRICGQSVHQPEAYYCQSCAFKKGICAMCGVRLVDTTKYNQCAV